MIIKNSNINIAIDIMREAAQWLIDKGERMWRLEDLTAEKIMNGISEENVYVGFEDSLPIAAMILQWQDTIFWEQIKPFESGFIHKLCVKRKYAGKGYAKEMLAFAEAECRKRKIGFLRLDTAGDRPKLCSFYESLGFKQVQRRLVGPNASDMAFYEKKILSRDSIEVDC